MYEITIPRLDEAVYVQHPHQRYVGEVVIFTSDTVREAHKVALAFQAFLCLDLEIISTGFTGEPERLVDEQTN
tara:strand:+ start:711 stop:929 length:219 start_codon:yes stop_codon:yes gene_type:complete